MDQIKTEEGLRCENNVVFVEEMLKSAAFALEQAKKDAKPCPCIRMLLLEHYTTDELKAFVKITSAIGALCNDQIENFCPEHTTLEEELVTKAELSAHLSLIEHALVELDRRESEFTFSG